MAQDLSHIGPILKRYTGDLDVQHVRPTGDVGAAGTEQGGIAARHDGAARTGTPVEVQITADFRLNRQNSASFGSEGWNPALAAGFAFAVCGVIFFGTCILTK